MLDATYGAMILISGNLEAEKRQHMGDVNIRRVNIRLGGLFIKFI